MKSMGTSEHLTLGITFHSHLTPWITSYTLWSLLQARQGDKLSKMTSGSPGHGDFANWEGVLYGVGLNMPAHYCSSKSPWHRTCTSHQHTRHSTGRETCLGAAKLLPPLQFDSEKWRVPVCDRTPSWGHEDKIWTLLLLQLIQLLHRYYLVLISPLRRWPPDWRVHRRQGGTLTWISSVKNKSIQALFLKIKSEK